MLQKDRFEGQPQHMVNRSLDLIIYGGTIMDGSGGTPYSADVGVAGDQIVEIGDLSGMPARQELQANGAAVAPGFIDAHGHSDYTLLVDGRAVSQISQGVTTEVIGNCGHGCEPLSDDLERFTGNIYGFSGDVGLSWRTTAEYFEHLSRAQTAINVLPLTPAGNLRRAAIGNGDGNTTQASPEERETMRGLIEAAMDAGSNGISFGLEYREEASATFDELVEQSRIVGQLGGLVAVHTRDKDFHAVEAVEEAILIARESGAPVQVSHVLPRRTAPDDSLERIVDTLESARADGLDIAFDVHTRTHGITNLSDCIPVDVLAKGDAQVVAQLSDPSWSKTIRNGDSIIHRFSDSGWDRVLVFLSKYTPQSVGRSIAEIAEEVGCDPWEAIRRLLVATNGDVNDVMVVCDSYAETDILNTASLPGCLVGSDATALCPDGPLGDSKFLGAYTWAAWFYSNVTRSPVRMSPEKAVRKLSAEPAERFGIADRGVISPGKKADLVVFDPERFGTLGSIANPNVLAEGVHHVVVNGEIALSDSRITTNRGGKLLTRSTS